MKSFAQENIEDGVLCMMKIQYQCQEMKQALEQIFRGLDKHASLQQKLKENFEDICKIHDMQSYSIIDNFVNVKNDESWIVKKEEFAQDLVTNCEDEVDDFIYSSDDIKIETDVCQENEYSNQDPDGENVKGLFFIELFSSF